MNANRLQRWIDELHDTSSQQWLLRLVAVLAPLGAMASVAADAGRWWPFGMALIAVLAVASAFRPDTHTAAAVIGIVVWHWLEVVDRVDTVWLPVTACCLLMYHSLIALTATFPAGGVVPTPTLLHWLRRTTLGGCVTVAMWAAVTLLDRRDAAGNGLLTALALAVLAGGAVEIRSRSLDEPG